MNRQVDIQMKRLKILIKTDKMNSAHPNFRIGYKLILFVSWRGWPFIYFYVAFDKKNVIEDTN